MICLLADGAPIYMHAAWTQTYSFIFMKYWCTSARPAAAFSGRSITSDIPTCQHRCMQWAPTVNTTVLLPRLPDGKVQYLGSKPECVQSALSGAAVTFMRTTFPTVSGFGRVCARYVRFSKHKQALAWEFCSTLPSCAAGRCSF